MIGIPDAWPPSSLMYALTRDDQLALASLGTARALPNREILMLEGDKGEEVFLLLDGFVKVTAYRDGAAETVLAIRPRGELVGEFALLDRRPRSATVTACGSIVAVRIGRERFLEFLQAHPEAGLEITRGVVRKMRSATSRRIDERTRGASAKLARVLHELAADYGQEHPEGLRIELTLTQVELGALAGVAESTAEAILSRWRRQGVIGTGYRRVVVRDLPALASLGDDDDNP
ncbi:Crp/Fnr family transcriptional regulator [Microbispora sp. NPDC049125]|uniref:Crp/Fnr family transcriptional regulator n=1 Tax=Microbispora sp. NPDC049125 TaxID=3154929 RepID=UPI003467431C